MPSFIREVENLPYVYCSPDLCTGCRACELVCSAVHEKVFNPRRSRIRVVREEPAIDVAFTCHQCTNAPCIAACPTGAIIELPSGLVSVDESRCIGCSLCVEACPFGAIYLIDGVAKKCDLCAGDPACVKRCPTNALRIVYPEQISAEKRRDRATAIARSKMEKSGVTE
jgi:Fe-S-cluster-containing hydrogenase component 2